MGLSNIISPPFLTITTTGFAATIAQIIVLRELLVLFYGNELSSGLIFAGWLLWNGLGSSLSGKWASRTPPRSDTLALFLTLLAVVLPISVLLIRAARMIFILPAGELPGIGKMLVLSMASTSLVCPISGTLFGICWAFQHQKNGAGRPLGIYLGEALGAASGGLVFYFIFLPYFSAFTIVWITSGLTLAASGWLLWSRQAPSKTLFARIIFGITILLIALAAYTGPRLDARSRIWQWGSALIAVRDTAYHNIALLRKAEQVSVFTNGLWLFSAPDRLSAEHSVHLALLQHPNPKTVLILGGGIAGLLEEILKHPEILRIDYVEPDPDLIPFIRPYLPPATIESLQRSTVFLFHEDPRAFLQRTPRQYDVVMMNAGDPITTRMSRFYTEEFFSHVKNRLSPGGIFSFAVSGGEDILGPNQARFLGSIDKTVRQVFPKALIYPGDTARFFATDKSGRIVADFLELSNRIIDRNLQLAYVRDDILQDALNPFRLDYMKSVLAGIPGSMVNRDFFPICYFHNLMLWATQWHPMMQRLLQTLSEIRIRWIWTALMGVAALMVPFFWIGRSRFKIAVELSVLVTGAVGMVFQVILLLGFQIVEGFVYRQLALIIAFFMAGLAAGAGWIRWKSPFQGNIVGIRWSLICVQALICLYPLGLMGFLPLIQGTLYSVWSPKIIGLLFSLLSLSAGILGGFQFSLAVSAMDVSGKSTGATGGVLYALDLVGAAGGAFLAACIILPIYGIMNTLMILSALSGICLLTLLRGP